MKSKRVDKVSRFHPLGTMDFCTKFHDNPCNTTAERQPDIAIPEAMLLALLKTIILPLFHSPSLSVFLSSYTWFVPIKWMKTGVEQQQHWLLQKTGMVIVTPTALLYLICIQEKKRLPPRLVNSTTGVNRIFCLSFFFLYFPPDAHIQMRVSGEDWVLANTNVSGYFRVNYDLDNWDRLLSLLNTNHQVSMSH